MDVAIQTWRYPHQIPQIYLRNRDEAGGIKHDKEMEKEPKIKETMDVDPRGHAEASK